MLNVQLPFDSRILLLNIYSRELKTCPHKNLYRNDHEVIHDGPQMEIAQISFNWLMNKQNVVCPYNKILVGHKKNKVLIQS